MSFGSQTAQPDTWEGKLEHENLSKKTRWDKKQNRKVRRMALKDLERGPFGRERLK